MCGASLEAITIPHLLSTSNRGWKLDNGPRGRLKSLRLMAQHFLPAASNQLCSDEIY